MNIILILIVAFAIYIVFSGLTLRNGIFVLLVLLVSYVLYNYTVSAFEWMDQSLRDLWHYVVHRVTNLPIFR